VQAQLSNWQGEPSSSRRFGEQSGQSDQIISGHRRGRLTIHKFGRPFRSLLGPLRNSDINHEGRTDSEDICLSVPTGSVAGMRAAMS